MTRSTGPERTLLDDLRADVRHWRGSGSRLASTLKFAAAFGPQALIGYRLGRWINRSARDPGRWIPALLLTAPCAVLTAIARTAYDIDLDSTADIGPGLKIFHLGGVRLRHCTLGDGCVIHHQVRVEPLPGDVVGPQIGSGVWIGPHARVIGRVHVGDRATIAAGAVVTQDVPAGALVVGDPARTTLIQYDNSALL